MKLDRNSYGTVTLVMTICAILMYVIFKTIDIAWIKWPLSIFLWLVCIWQVAFHIVPDRRRAGSDKSVASVADGVIVFLDKVYEKEYFKSECTMVSIYMDFWDVHANFWPIDGEITYCRYYPGKHFFAFLPKASENNEHTCTAIRNSSGQDVFFKQLAGGFARRIVNYAENGMKVRACSQCGIIKFGSRVDIFLPLEAEIKVKLGDTVRACETVIAEL